MEPQQSTSQPPRRRPPFPWFGRGQLWIVIGLMAVLLGSMLPWWDTFVGRVYGLDNYGIYSLWAAALGLVGAFSLRQSLYEWLPGLGALIALGVVIWVLLSGTSDCAVDVGSLCRPAYGLILAGAGAVNTLFVVIRERIAGT